MSTPTMTILVKLSTSLHIKETIKESDVHQMFNAKCIKGRLLANGKLVLHNEWKHSQRLLLVTCYIGHNVLTNGYGCSVNIQCINYDI